MAAAANVVANNLVGLFADAGMAMPNQAQLAAFNVTLDGIAESYRPTYQQMAKVQRAVQGQNTTRAISQSKQAGMTPYVFVTALSSAGAILQDQAHDAHALITLTIVGKGDEAGLPKAIVFQLWWESAEMVFTHMPQAPANIAAGQAFNWRIRFTLTTLLKADLERAVSLKKLENKMEIEFQTKMQQMKAEQDQKIAAAVKRLAPPGGRGESPPARRQKNTNICEKFMEGSCTFRNCKFLHGGSAKKMREVNTRKNLGVTEARIKEIATEE
eukprot:g6144.t1